MAEKKTPKRSFESELRSLPVELVPPDPSGLERPTKKRTPADQQPGEVAPEPAASLVAKLIERIKRI